ncbi:MAG: M48 family metallopeptidase [Ruminococcaceae bacterium]|nr:M48 family metallopeptidase [Oscillospiraceae bacterium]
MIFRNIECELIRSNRKTLSLEVKRGGRVVIRSPFRFSEQKITEFLNLRYEWLIRAIEKQKQKTDWSNISPEQIQLLNQKAKEILPKRVEYYSKIMQLYPKSIKINHAKTRFGSCSSQNNINFSVYLMLYPVEAIDYVVVHELAHIKYKNHQKEFYNLVEKYLPNYKKYAALLKR